jgi:effector-binding domain-containing protein
MSAHTLSSFTAVAVLSAALVITACSGPSATPSPTPTAATSTETAPSVPARNTPVPAKTPTPERPVGSIPTVTYATGVVVVELAETPAMTITTTAKMEEVGTILADVLPAVFNHVFGLGGATVGMPFARYRDNGDGTFVIEGGAAVVEHVDETDRIKATTLPAGPAAKLVHVGPYEGLPTAHATIDKWLADTGREAAGDPWEVYATDPGEEPDSSKWVTEVYYPLKAT